MTLNGQKGRNATLVCGVSEVVAGEGRVGPPGGCLHHLRDGLCLFEGERRRNSPDLVRGNVTQAHEICGSRGVGILDSVTKPEAYSVLRDAVRLISC